MAGPQLATVSYRRCVFERRALDDAVAHNYEHHLDWYMAAMKEAAEIIRGVLGGEALDFDGKVFSAHVPALTDDAETPRWDVPLYFAGTGPMMLKAAARSADGLLTASITTPAFVRYVREQVAAAGRDPDTLDLGWELLLTRCHFFARLPPNCNVDCSLPGSIPWCCPFASWKRAKLPSRRLMVDAVAEQAGEQSQ